MRGFEYEGLENLLRETKLNSMNAVFAIWCVLRFSMCQK